MKGMLMVSMIAGATGVASAAETTMNDGQLDALLTGNTVYIALPAGSPAAPDGGIAPFKFGADGSAAAKLPVGMTLVGTWKLAGGQYCVDWDNGPKNSCTKLVKSAGGIVMNDAADDTPRGTVERIVVGNPENL
ncbi:MAG: hypothetical protein AAF940_01165 [Pseudomonadota bacterium]